MTDHTDVLKQIKNTINEANIKALTLLVLGDVEGSILSHGEALDKIHRAVDEALASAEKMTDEKSEEAQTAPEDEEQKETSDEDIFAALGLDHFIPLIDRLGKGLRSDTSIKEDSAQPKKSSDPLGDILSAFFDGRP